jgi:hypothetical protein
VLIELTCVLTEEVAVLIEFTLVERVPIAVLREATDVWRDVISVFSVAQPATSVATDLPIAVTLAPIALTLAWLEPAPLTVKEPMFEAEKVGLLVLLDTEAPTR